MEERVARTATPAPAPEPPAPQRPTRTVQRRVDRRAEARLAPRTPIAAALAEPTSDPGVGVGGVATGVPGRVAPLPPAPTSFAAAGPAPLRRDVEDDDAFEHAASPPAPAAPRRTIRRAHRPAPGGAVDTARRAIASPSAACRVRPLAPIGAAGPSTAARTGGGRAVEGPLRRSIVAGGTGRTLMQRALSGAPSKAPAKYAGTLAGPGGV